MSLRNLPEAKTFQRPKNFQFDAPSDVLARWAETPFAADDGEENTISMYDFIGEDFWTGGGVTANRIRAALQKIGKNDVVVKLNSPGGDMFEGIAIYNLLREHPAKVTVKVMGWAASAASIIAMAGDEIKMGLGTFMMVHNAWGMVIGNKHEMREVAAMFDGFDSAIVDIYEARTGMNRKGIEALMDAETFMGPTEAIDRGFADVLDEGIEPPSGDAKNMDRALMARRQTEAALARAGFSREVRSEMLSEMGVTSAAPRDASRNPAARDAGVDIAAIQRLIETIKT
ncbi:Clp protease ClpP [Nitratireductor sp. CAU 1489]|uniref:ATP-dependent Clp protease proteolytic subunit n=2 Tax=Nitratireductor arenosus TaxID=2682096 RepID=A0A844QHU0_9HYPH|nr:head maturation protease, ClpP-related [Nitratireductor arenosus]MVA98855.1 Clp protease ClpP [Nitratireductor arenosus]